MARHRRIIVSPMPISLYYFFQEAPTFEALIDYLSPAIDIARLTTRSATATIPPLFSEHSAAMRLAEETGQAVNASCRYAAHSRSAR